MVINKNLLKIADTSFKSIAYHYWLSIMLLRNLMLFLFPKFILMQVFLLVTKMCLFLDTLCLEQDHPGNVKCLGICIFCKSFLALRVVNFSFLKKRLNLALLIGINVCNFVSLSGQENISAYFCCVPTEQLK